MSESNDQNLNRANTFIDAIQELWGSTGLSKVTPKPVSETIDSVSAIVDIQQDVDQSSGVPVWKATVASIAGGVASAPVFVVGEGLTAAAATAALVSGGFLGLSGSYAIYYAGTVTTIEIGDEVSNVTRDVMISLLTSPGYMEAEDVITSKVDTFVKDVTDILSKTTGWSQQPVWLNNVLKAAEWTSLEVDNLEGVIKSSLNSLISDSHTISDHFQSYLDSFRSAETVVERRVDPLTLDLDGDGVELVNVAQSTAFFDLDVVANVDAEGNFDGTYTSDGVKEQVGWVSGDDGLLALDKNNNGAIDNILELFGKSNKTGTEELREYDLNNDGKIDSNDAIFSQLKVWQDVNQDGISQASELKSLTDLKITSINFAANLDFAASQTNSF